MSAQTGTKRSARFLVSKTELSELIHDTLSEPIIEAAEMDQEAEERDNDRGAEAFVAYCAKSSGDEYDDDVDGSMYAMDFGTRFPEPQSAKEIMDDAAARELEERFYNERDQEYDECDEIDFELAMDDFFEAAFTAAKTDPKTNSMLKGILETHISPEARAICKQADRNNPTIENKDRTFFDNVIGDAAEHAIENSGEYDHLR